MTRHMRSLATLMFVLSFSYSAFAERYKYSELQIKDYDEMATLVRGHIKKSTDLLKAEQKKDESAEASPEVIEELRAALLLLLSRPNQDNMLSKLMPEVRKELTNLNAFEDNLASITDEAVTGLKNSNLPTVTRSTYLFVLENFLSEFKPEVREKDELRGLFEKIRDAKVDVPKEVTKDLKLRSMLKVESPSERAKRVLDAIKPK